MFASFVQMGFPIIFQPAVFECSPDQDCSQATQCNKDYILSPTVKSVAYSFNLVCQRKSVLTTCFTAFLVGGFVGSLYYGEVIERRGRRYGVIEALVMMVCGLYVSVVAGSAVLFSFGVFFFSAGFRGFYNGALLTLCEVMTEVSRAWTPMLLSIGWAVGQITIALLCVWVNNWRVIFLFTVIPLTLLLYSAYVHTKESPRFLVTKQRFEEATQVLSEIAAVNLRSFRGCSLRQQIDFEDKMQGYKQIMVGGEVQTKQKHYSYVSLLRFNSVRLRVILVGGVWSVFSLSYFISASSQLNPQRNVQFNIALAGAVEVVAYLCSMVTSLNYARVQFIRRLILAAVVVHLLYFFVLPKEYSGLPRLLVMTLDIAVRVITAIGNTFLAIYSIQLFPTTVRHFTLGILGFITKLMYFLSFPFSGYWLNRNFHCNLILGFLFIAAYILTPKLRETKELPFKDNLSQDPDSLLMNDTIINTY